MSVFLAVYPTSRGFGYACVGSSKKIFEAGVVSIRPACNRRNLKRIRRLMEFFKPKVILLRDPKVSLHRGNRIEGLIAEITALAAQLKIETYQYSLEEIKNVFELYEATTKYTIAQKIIETFPELKHRAPKQRKFWQNDHYQMCMFEAFALLITHVYLAE